MKAVVAPISKSSFIPTLHFLNSWGHSCMWGCGFCARPPFFSFFGRLGVGISYFVKKLLRVESAQQASPIPQKQNKKDLNPPPKPPKKETCTCKHPSNSPQK
jgi:hypothetical protein